MLITYKSQEVVSSETGFIFDIKRFAIHDGKGIRTTVFFKGCPLRCAWCHNPESQKMAPEKSLKGERIGEKVSVAFVMSEIEKDSLFYDESCGGATFSGGEPLMQPVFLKTLLTECRKKDIHTVLDTSGFATALVFDSIIDKVDLFFYDLKLMDKNLHVQYTGVPNGQIIENLRTLSGQGKKTVIRFPVIPGITDTPGNLKDIAGFVSGLPGIEKIDLLPFHGTATPKYGKLKKDYLLKELQPPKNGRLEELKKYFENHGLKVKIGG